jgi:hypothetical protein
MRHYAHVLNDDVREAKAETQGAEAAFAGPAKVARKVARSAESESGWTAKYLISLVGPPGLEPGTKRL